MTKQTTPAPFIRIDDIDRNSHHDKFTVQVTGAWHEITFDQLGDFMVSAGLCDGFDGQRLIWYGDDEFYFDNFEQKSRKGRDRTQDVVEYVRHDMEDSVLIKYFQTL